MTMFFKVMEPWNHFQIIDCNYLVSNEKEFLNFQPNGLTS